MNPFARFLNFWAGVDNDLLQWCPQHERGKYLSMGALVLLTGTFAFMASGYAFFTIFQSVPIAVLLGVLWALLILNLDRLLLTTFPKTLGGVRQTVHATIRFVLATFIGITIAHPLTVRMFQKEIKNKIVSEARDELGNFAQKRDAAKAGAQSAMLTMKSGLPEFGAVDQRKAERDALGAQLTKCESQMVQDKQKYLCEADGTCGTGLKTCGPVCEEKKAAYRTTEAQCKALRSNVEQAILSLTQAEHALVPAASRIDALFRDRDAVIDHDYRVAIAPLESPEESSFFERSEAMGRLGGKAQTKALFVMLSLIFVETAAVLLKVMTQADSADALAVAIHDEFARQRIPPLAEVLADTGRPRTKPHAPDPAPTADPEPRQTSEPAVANVRVMSEWWIKAFFI
ncbi:MAG TPA: DUF4407 domain-containing protein, partial [Thermoanaerobaculia bacterium]